MIDCRFASAAPEEEFVYGACEPGYDRQTAPTIDAWIEFMDAQGIERVCCLLSQRQVRTHNALLTQYRDRFGPDNVAHVPVTDHRLMDPEPLMDDILPFCSEAVDDGAPVVVHCKAGLGRTGQALAAWLVYQHGYGPESAIDTVSDRHRMPDEAVQRGAAIEDELIALLQAVA